MFQWMDFGELTKLQSIIVTGVLNYSFNGIKT